MIQDIIAIWQKYSYVFIEGIRWTFILSGITIFFSSILGAFIAFMKMSKIKIFNLVADGFIGLVRGLPILLQLYFFWLRLPKLLPIELSDRMCIIVALIVYSSAYVAEVIRAGIEAVDYGQTEAAKSLGLRNTYMMRYIILPQAIKNILPALGNEFIMMLKQTSLASVFFVGELMTAWRTVQSATYKGIPALVIVGLLYLIMIWVLTNILRVFERRLRESD